MTTKEIHMLNDFVRKPSLTYLSRLFSFVHDCCEDLFQLHCELPHRRHMAGHKINLSQYVMLFQLEENSLAIDLHCCLRLDRTQCNLFECKRNYDLAVVSLKFVCFFSFSIDLHDQRKTDSSSLNSGGN